MRIDLDSAHGAELGETPVREVMFLRVKDLDAVMQTIGERAGSQIYVEEQVEGARLWIDYENDYAEIECEGMEEHRCSYTREDLVAKSKRTIASLDSYSALYYEERTRHHRLRSGLKQLAKDEIDRATRRREFFERQSSPQVFREDGTIKAFARILKMLDSD